MHPPPMLHRAVFEPELPASEPHVPGAAEDFEEGAILERSSTGEFTSDAIRRV
jgi:hypothetical protein